MQCGPIMSHTLLKEKVLPHIEKGTPLFFILIDNLRFDQWKAIQPIFVKVSELLKKIHFTAFYQQQHNMHAMPSFLG